MSATTPLPLVLDIAISVLVVTGVAFALVGSWGLARLSDFFRRLHGPSKATTLGVGCVLIGSALWFAWQGKPSLHELLITLFLFLTAPVSAHLLVKAALKLDPGVRPPDPSAPPSSSATSAASAASAVSVASREPGSAP